MNAPEVLYRGETTPSLVCSSLPAGRRRADWLSKRELDLSGNALYPILGGCQRSKHGVSM